MVRTGLFALLGLLLLSFSNSQLSGAAADDDASFQTTLALQRAMESARHSMLAGESKKAVDMLEDQLSRVNGHAAFLRLLREAYRGLIKDMWQANNAAGAKRYLERLCVLEPSAANDPTLRPPDVTAKIAVPEPKAEPEKKPGLFPNFALNHKKTQTPAAAAKPTAVRAKVEDSRLDADPFAPANMRPAHGRIDAKSGDGRAGGTSEHAQQLVAKAQEEFSRRQYAAARVLYEQAFQIDKTSLQGQRDRWAYCMLDHVTEQLKQPGQAPYADLQREVRGAMNMDPRIEQTGKWLLGEIDKRQRTQVSAAAPENTGAANTGAVATNGVTSSVSHLGRNKEGWLVAETPFFRIFHNQAPEQIDKVAAIAEKTRVEMYRKWFGSGGLDWQPKCELILHPTAGDYTRMTGVPGTSPGHSRIESDPSGQRVIGRRMDLRCDNPGMLETVLPHETTHVVLAGMFAGHNVPRWADEGIAVLTEPAYKIDQHRRNLHKSNQDGLLFGVKELMQLKDYPQPRRISAFYAQSVCLVEFMTEMRGPQVFTTFVRDGLREGYDAALRKHYGMDMNELQSRWQQRLTSQTSSLAAGQ